MNSWLIRVTLIASCCFGMLAVSAGEMPGASPMPLAECKSGYCLLHPKGEALIYRGVANFDEAGTGTTGLLYPAPNAVGLVAAVLTHGLLVGSAKQEQKKKIQAEADKVLLPYQRVIGEIGYEQLWSLAISRLPSDAKVRRAIDTSDLGSDSAIESNLVISMTQDQSSLVLDNTIVFRKSGGREKSDYRSTIRVVSPAHIEAKPEDYWTKNSGEQLISTSADLIADSLQVAIRDYEALKSTPDNSPFKTIRYKEGEAEKFERAQVLSNECNRVLIRTLKGDLMLVPLARRPTGDSDDARCHQPSTKPYITSSLP